jgi:hypothetical protein
MTTAAELFRRALAHLFAHDIDAYADLFAPDGVVEWPFAPPDWARRVDGRDAIRAHVGANLARMRDAGRRFVALHDVVVHEVSPGEVVAELAVEVAAADGTSVRRPYVHVLRAREGAIASLRDYFSPATVSAAHVGARPAPARAFERLERASVELDAEAFAGAFAADGVLAWPFAPAGWPRRLDGREAIRARTREMMASARAAGRRITGYLDVVAHPSADPERGVFEFRTERVTHVGASQLPYVWIIRTRGDEIVELRDYYDSAAGLALVANDPR